jgi:hypothetical protein
VAPPCPPLLEPARADTGRPHRSGSSPLRDAQDHQGHGYKQRAADSGPPGYRIGKHLRFKRSDVHGAAVDAPTLPPMSDAKLIVANIWATGVSPDSRPLQHLREPTSAIPCA